MDKLKQRFEEAMQDGWDSGDFDDMINAAAGLAQKDIDSAVKAARIDEIEYIYKYIQAALDGLSDAGLGGMAKNLKERVFDKVKEDRLRQLEDKK